MPVKNAKKPAEFQALVLAGLLHDIGKMVERAGEKITPEDERLLPICCPGYKGYHTHRHLLHGGRFIREHLGDRFSLVENLVLYHHKPDSYPDGATRRLAYMVALSDRLSSGERIDLDKGGRGQPRHDPLASVFSSLDGAAQSFFPLQPLGPETPFPVAEQRRTPGDGAYADLYARFKAEVTRIDFGASFDEYSLQLLHLLEKHTLFIPSAAYCSVPDISLFHHQKNSAAIAACLYRVGFTAADLIPVIDSLKQEDRAATGTGDASMALVAGDISGIQQFIYAVTSTRALKGLRGRSLYLQLLADAAARNLLGRFQLSRANLIYCGGGNFYLLAPMDKTVLESFRQETDALMLDAHSGVLGLAVACEPLQWSDFHGGGFGLAWERLGRRLGREKKRRWHDRARHSYPVVFGPWETGGAEKAACPVCSREMQEAGRDGLCPHCESFQDLSRNLAEPYLVVRPAPGRDRSEKSPPWLTVLARLGWEYRFSGTPDPQALVINRTDFLERGCAGFITLGRHLPRGAGGDILTLEDLAANATGIAKWGVLRADVDNLGAVFSTRLPAENRSMSRVSTLSYLLSLFFARGLDEILGDSRYSQGTYLAYSGGDDLLLVGAWSALPGLAALVNQRFREFVSGSCSLSAGIFLAPGERFPVSEAARAAGSSLDKAKQAGKDRLVIFDQALPWAEFPGIDQVKERIRFLVEEHNAPRSLFSMLYAGWEEKKRAGNCREGIEIERIWRLLYALKRLAERLSGQGRGQVVTLEQLKTDFIADNSLRPYLDIAVRWADYLTRKEEKRHG